MAAMTPEAAMGAVKALIAIPFFPSDDFAQTMVANEIQKMCATTEQAMWLVSKMYRTFDKWPGPREMRAAFCSKFKPADGVEVGSTIFEDGVPSDSEQGGKVIESRPTAAALPAGHSVSADPDYDEQVMRVARMKRLR